MLTVEACYRALKISIDIQEKCIGMLFHLYGRVHGELGDRTCRPRREGKKVRKCSDQMNQDKRGASDGIER